MLTVLLQVQSYRASSVFVLCCRSLHSQQADGGAGTEPTEQVAAYQQPGLDYSLQRRDTTPVYPHMIASTQHIQSEYVGTVLMVLQEVGSPLLPRWVGWWLVQGTYSTTKAPTTTDASFILWEPRARTDEMGSESGWTGTWNVRHRRPASHFQIITPTLLENCFRIFTADMYTD
jgi:hypothetical protein